MNINSSLVLLAIVLLSSCSGGSNASNSANLLPVQSQLILDENKKEKDSFKAPQQVCSKVEQQETEYALCLYGNGNKVAAQKILQEVLLSNKDDSKARLLLSAKSLSQPYLTYLSNVQLKAWLARDLGVGVFKQTPPKTPVYSESILLTQGEFESTKGFKKRVRHIQDRINDKDKRIKALYDKEYQTYLDNKRAFELKIRKIKAQRELDSPKMYRRFMHENFTQKLGELKVVYAGYAPNSKTLFAKVVSEKLDFSKKISLVLSDEEAGLFKSSSAQAVPLIEIEANRDNLRIVNIVIELFGKKYLSNMVDNIPNFNVDNEKINSKIN
jgi:hypothetical protein